MSHFEFIIQAISVSCPSCNEVFATQTPFKMSEMTPTLPVEADLHRVLPYGAVRACLVTICPQCQYSWWTNTFNRHYFLPVGIAITPEVDHPKKFAHAILTGRKNNFHLLDRALLALNGYWCAKESNQDTSKWLTLAIQELAIAVNDSIWQSNRSRYQYVLAELLRLSGRFEQAINAFALVNSSANLPQELIDNQKNLASKKNSDPVLLTNKQVQQIFFPKLISELTKEETKKEQAIQSSEKIQSDFSTTDNNLFDNITNRSNILPPKRPLKAAV
jgi:hypothetical protein